MAEIFFSYAGNDNTNGKNVLRDFYTDLNSRLKTKFPGDPVFFDKVRLEAGDKWTNEIERELRTCHVFIYVRSAAYYASEWCGKEWRFFSERLDACLKQDTEGNIKKNQMIPIILDPQCKCLPCDEGIHYSLANLRTDHPYEKVGLLALKTMKKHEDDYKELIEVLAALLYEKMESCPLPYCDTICDIEELESPFHEKTDLRYSAPKSSSLNQTNFAYIAANIAELGIAKKNKASYGEVGYQWKPFHPGDSTEIYNIVQEIVFQGKYHYHCIDNINHLMDRIAEAKKKNEIVVAIADPWSLKLSSYSRIMEECDDLNCFNFAIMVPYVNGHGEMDKDCTEVEKIVARTFKSNIARESREYFKNGIAEIKTFKVELSSTLTHVRNKIIETSEYINPMPEGVFKRKPELSIKE